MFAHYVVLSINKQPTPAIVPPWDDAGWDRFVKRNVDIRHVLSAGEVTWGEPDQPLVQCHGEGLFQRASGSPRRTVRKSRGAVDAALLTELISQPLGYVVLNLDGLGERPIIVAPYDDFETAVSRYQDHLSRDIVGGGEVIFGLDEEASPFCHGTAQLGDWLRPYQVHSRGDDDAKLFKRFFRVSLL
jgi:hypothetical protein